MIDLVSCNYLAAFQVFLTQPVVPTQHQMPQSLPASGVVLFPLCCVGSASRVLPFAFGPAFLHRLRRLDVNVNSPVQFLAVIQGDVVDNFVCRPQRTT